LLATDAKATKRPSSLMSGSKLSLLPAAPAVVMLTLAVVDVTRSRTRTSSAELVSPGSDASRVSNTTRRPSAEVVDWVGPVSCWVTMLVVPAARSRTNTHVTPSGSTIVPGELQLNTTLPPSPLSDGSRHRQPARSTPSGAMLTSSIVPAARSRR
jgi:hypothetical protein